jgi:hypothetical protein
MIFVIVRIIPNSRMPHQTAHVTPDQNPSISCKHLVDLRRREEVAIEAEERCPAILLLTKVRKPPLGDIGRRRSGPASPDDYGRVELAINHGFLRASMASSWATLCGLSFGGTLMTISNAALLVKGRHP